MSCFRPTRDGQAAASVLHQIVLAPEREDRRVLGPRLVDVLELQGHGRAAPDDAGYFSDARRVGPAEFAARKMAFFGGAETSPEVATYGLGAGLPSSLPRHIVRPSGQPHNARNY